MGNVNIAAFFFGLTFLMHLFFAMGVFSAARGLRARGDGVLVRPSHHLGAADPPVGMFAMLPYWLIHHSSLRAVRAA